MIGVFQGWKNPGAWLLMALTMANVGSPHHGSRHSSISVLPDTFQQGTQGLHRGHKMVTKELDQGSRGITKQLQEGRKGLTKGLERCSNGAANYLHRILAKPLVQGPLVGLRTTVPSCHPSWVPLKLCQALQEQRCSRGVQPYPWALSGLFTRHTISSTLISPLGTALRSFS